MKKLLVAASAAVVLLSGTTAQAARYLVTVQGTIASGFDDTNLLGSGSDLAGLNYTLQLTVDEEAAAYLFAQSYYKLHYGNNGDPGPVTDATLQVGGGAAINIFDHLISGGTSENSSQRYDNSLLSGGNYCVNLPGNCSTGLRYLVSTNKNTFDAGGYTRSYTTFEVQNYTSDYGLTPRVPLDTSIIPSAPLLGGVASTIFYRIDEQWASNGMGGYSLVSRTGTEFQQTSNVTVRVAAIPEPATWAMMIMGFGLTGSLIRRRGKTLLVE